MTAPEMVDQPFRGLPKIRSRGPLAEKVYAILKESIIQGKFASGMWLQEEALTKALGVSRTPLREAFNRLKSEGFIEVLPRKGAHIIELSDDELADLFEVREQIETVFFVRSASAVPQATIDRLRSSMQQSEQAMRHSVNKPEQWNEERIRYLRNDRLLHDTLIKASGNKCWERLYFDIRDRIEIFGNQLSFDQEWFDVAIEDHYAIIDAILAGDYETGCRAMRQHIANVHRGIVRIRTSR